jgi:lipopolysaccharide export LptBFGC system permease protein LptF
MRTPWTIWWQLWRELARLLVLTCAVVVVVTSFAVAVKPLADGRLGTLEMLRFMLYASVPMLQYALPFAAGFAATLVYHRMAQDNELSAAYAGGISHKRLLIPAGLLGIVLSAGLFVLADQAMPRFLRKMSELIASDVMKLMQNAFARGDSVALGKQVFFAEDLEEINVDPSSGASRRFVLKGLVAVQLDKDANVTGEVASRFAQVFLFPTRASADDDPSDPSTNKTGSTIVVMKLQDSVIDKGNIRVPELAESTLTYRVADSFADNPKFHTWSELSEIAATPERMNWIENDRRKLASGIAERWCIERLRTDLASDRKAQLTDPVGRPVIIHSSSIVPASGDRGFELTPPGKGLPIEIDVTTEDGRPRSYRAARAYLSLPNTPDAKASALKIELEELSVGDESGVVADYTIKGLIPAGDPLPELLNSSITELSAHARKLAADPSATRLGENAAGLERAVDALRREITSKQQERIAASLACFVMILCGSVMAMRLKDSMPLNVYLWSFLPALGALFTIAGGQSLTHTYGHTGLWMLYGGVGLLALLTLWEYTRLAKH